VLDGDAARSADNARFFSLTESDDQKVVTLEENPFDAPHLDAESATEALASVLASTGASRPVRDAVDNRLIQDVRNRTGSLINSQKEVGGWPDYPSPDPPTDSDADGMPDTWESANELNPQDPADNSLDRDGDGYSNIEEYLNSLALPPL